MSDSPDISANIDLDLSGWQRAIRDGLRSADDFDDALDDMIKQANEAESALNEISTGIDVDVNTDFSSITEADAALQSLDTDIAPLVEVHVTNAAATQALLDDFNATLTPKLDIETSELDSAQRLLDALDKEAPTVLLDMDYDEIGDAETALGTLDSETPSILVDVDYSEIGDAETAVGTLDGEAPSILLDVDYNEVGDAQKAVDDLDSDSADIPVTTDTTDADADTKTIEGKLDTLRNLAVINLVFQGLEMIPGPESIPLLGAIIEADTAARNLEASLGKIGESNAGQYAQGAQDVYASGKGDSQLEAANAYGQVVQLTTDATGKLATTSEDFTNITKEGFTVAKQSGKEFNEVLQAADTLVKSGLAPDYKTAFDVLSTGFSEGLDKGGQFLDTIKEKSTVFSQLGIDSQTMLNLMKTGLEGGAKDVNQLGEVFGSLNGKIQEALSGKGQAYDLFKSLGLSDELKAVKAGDMTGGQFAGAFFDAIKEKQGTRGFDMASVMGVMGGKVEDLTLPVVISLDPTQVQGAVSDITGATLKVDALINGDLGTSWETLRRTVEGELAQSVSTALDIPGKIKQFSDGVSEMSKLIQGGATIPEAIEVAFNVPGLNDTIMGLESTLGNLGITFMELVAHVLDALGQGDAAAGVRGTVADLAGNQLTFDLKLAKDGDDVANVVTRAVERGASKADVEKAIGTAGQELIDEGDLDKVHEFVDALHQSSEAATNFPPEFAQFLTGRGIDPKNIEAVQAAIADLNKNMVNVPFGGKGAALDNVGIIKEGALNQISTGLDTAGAIDTALAPIDAGLKEAEESVTQRLENMKQAAITKLPGIAEVATSALTPMNETFAALGTVITGTDIDYQIMGSNIATNTGVLGSTLDTAGGYLDAFGGNAQTQFIDVVGGAVLTSQGILEAFGLDVKGEMEGATGYVDDFITHFLSIGSMDVDVPTPGTGGGGSSGGGAGTSFASGGLIEAGDMAKVHGDETLVRGDQDISVLNRQTSSTIESAIAAFMATRGGGGGSGGNVYNITNNVVLNANGGAAAASATNYATQIRGY